MAKKEEPVVYCPRCGCEAPIVDRVSTIERRGLLRLVYWITTYEFDCENCGRAFEEIQGEVVSGRLW